MARGKNLEERVWLTYGRRVADGQFLRGCEIKVQGKRGVVRELVQAGLVEVLAGPDDSG